jgi:GNAT superfamily N-acetyltransferase
MPPEFSVRAASPDDTELILQMIREMAAAEQRQTSVTISHAALDRYVFADRPIADVFLGYWEGEPVAYLMLQNRFSSYRGAPILYVEDVFVRSRSRGQGLGKLMMQFAANLAVKRGCGAMHWSVGDWNTPALAFYDRLGTTRENGRVHYELQGPALQSLGKS